MQYVIFFQNKRWLTPTHKFHITTSNMVRIPADFHRLAYLLLFYYFCRTYSYIIRAYFSLTILAITGESNPSFLIWARILIFAVNALFRILFSIWTNLSLIFAVRILIKYQIRNRTVLVTSGHRQAILHNSFLYLLYDTFWLGQNTFYSLTLKFLSCSMYSYSDRACFHFPNNWICICCKRSYR